MKKLTCIFLLSLLFTLLAGCSKEDVQLEPLKTNDDVFLKKADKYVPFKGTFEVTIDTVLHFPPPPPKVQEVLGTGNVTHLGKTDLYILQNWFPPQPPILIPPYTGTGNGEMTFTAANGDLLFASYNDAEGFHDIAPPVLITFTGHFNGGTGRFENAAGSFTWDGEYYPATNSGTATVTGEIMYSK